MVETGSMAGDTPTETSATRSEARDPSDYVPMSEEQLRAAHVGVPTRLDGPVELVAYDVVELSPLPGLIAPNFLCAKLVYKMLTYRFAALP